MKYTPKNPNEHKFKPSIPKLQGFNKRQTNKKKKQKLSISIETNKMSIMDILFSGQTITKLTGYIRLSTFEDMIYTVDQNDMAMNIFNIRFQRRNYQNTHMI